MSFKHSKPTLFTALFFASMVSASVSCAAPGGDRGRPQGPPPEATKACADLAKDDACSFTGRRNDTVSGSCITQCQVVAKHWPVLRRWSSWYGKSSRIVFGITEG